MLIKQKRMYLDDCTISRWTAEGFKCFGLELVWDGNKKGSSCIPEGEYTVEMYNSPSRGIIVPQFLGVIGRSNIQIHPGNFTRQILGCQLPGDGLKDIDGDGIVDATNSANTFNKLMSILPRRFNVEIYS